MNIGETLKKLRKQKDMTQEQLADYLNISPQAVSRWEISSTLPDITLVPMLANIFDVTTDTLLGVDIDAKEKRIEAIVKEANKYIAKNQCDEAEKLLRAAWKDYPNSYQLMSELALVLSINIGYYDGRWNEEEKIKIEEERKPIREEIITLCEKILAECTDDNLRYWSIQRLCCAYASMGETEKAVSFAKKLPNITERDMITETFKGTKKYQNVQERIAFSAICSVLGPIGLLMSRSYVSLDDGSEPYNFNERIVLYHKIIDIINILIEKGDFGDFGFPLAGAHSNLAFLYAQKSDSSAALNHFRLAAKYAVTYESMANNSNPPNGEYSGVYASLLFKGLNFPSIIVHGPDAMMTENLLEKSRELDSVLPASELEEIRNELRKHTEIN